MSQKKIMKAVKMSTQPIDNSLIADLPADRGYDFNRPLYRCTVCAAQGESATHKYLDDCPFFDEK